MHWKSFKQIRSVRNGRYSNTTSIQNVVHWDVFICEMVRQNKSFAFFRNTKDIDQLIYRRRKFMGKRRTFFIAKMVNAILKSADSLPDISPTFKAVSKYEGDILLLFSLPSEESDEIHLPTDRSHI